MGCFVPKSNLFNYSGSSDFRHDESPQEGSGISKPPIIHGNFTTGRDLSERTPVTKNNVRIIS
jgi:hypothetical protein